LKPWRLVQLVAGGGILVVLGAAALMLWPLLWPPNPDASAQLVDGRLIGEATGYVGRIDRDARTVDVSASLVGWRPVVVVVDESTTITVQDREGGFGDLWKDMPVRVSYELVGDTRLARWIEVVTGDGEPSRPLVGEGGTQPASSSSVTLPSPPALSPDPPLALPPAPALAPTVASPPAAAAPAPALPSSPASEPAAVSPPAARVADRPAPSAPPPGPVSAPPPAKPPSASSAPPPSPVVVQPPAKPPSASSAPPPSPVVVQPPAKPPSSASSAPPPSPVVVQPPAKPPSAVVAEPPRRVEPPVVAGPRSVEPSAASRPGVVPPASSAARSSSAGGTDVDDGAAVIDWLLKDPRGR
jgi:hypothetical protein